MKSVCDEPLLSRMIGGIAEIELEASPHLSRHFSKRSWKDAQSLLDTHPRSLKPSALSNRLSTNLEFSWFINIVDHEHPNRFYVPRSPGGFQIYSGGYESCLAKQGN